MNQFYAMNAQEFKEAQAALQVAKMLGLIEHADFEALEQRRETKNKEIQIKLKQGEIVYGLTYYSAPAYLQYELTRFRLDFVVGAAPIRNHYRYRAITEKEKRSFYLENPDLFTRYHGDSFSYEEVEMIIEKRLREAEYNELIQNLLCQL